MLSPKVRVLDEAMKAAWSAFYDARRKLQLAEGFVPLGDYAEAVAKRDAWHAAGGALIAQMTRERA